MAEYSFSDSYGRFPQFQPVPVLSQGPSTLLNMPQYGQTAGANRGSSPERSPAALHGSPRSYLFDFESPPGEQASPRSIQQCRFDSIRTHQGVQFEGQPQQRERGSNVCVLQYASAESYQNWGNEHVPEGLWAGTDNATTNRMLDLHNTSRDIDQREEHFSPRSGPAMVAELHSLAGGSPGSFFEAYEQQYMPSPDPPPPCPEDYWSPYNTRGSHQNVEGPESQPTDLVVVQQIESPDRPERSSLSSYFSQRTQDSSIEAGAMGMSTETIMPKGNGNVETSVISPHQYQEGAFQYDQGGATLQRQAIEGRPMLKLYVTETMPPEASYSGSQFSSQDRISDGNGQLLNVPSTSGYDDMPSPGGSTISAASFTTPNILECGIDGCMKTYSGEYRKGNLQRHIRLKHANGGRTYPCEGGCTRVFNRQDARLKHYRRRHPQLNPGLPVPRRT